MSCTFAIYQPLMLGLFFNQRGVDLQQGWNVVSLGKFVREYSVVILSLGCYGE
ncbi:MAG: hypothetical protein ACFCVB_11295 [Nodosilinea sp.]